MYIYIYVCMYLYIYIYYLFIYLYIYLCVCGLSEKYLRPLPSKSRRNPIGKKISGHRKGGSIKGELARWVAKWNESIVAQARVEQYDIYSKSIEILRLSPNLVGFRPPIKPAIQSISRDRKSISLAKSSVRQRKTLKTKQLRLGLGTHVPCCSQIFPSHMTSHD